MNVESLGNEGPKDPEYFADVLGDLGDLVERTRDYVIDRRNYLFPSKGEPPDKIGDYLEEATNKLNTLARVCDQADELHIDAPGLVLSSKKSPAEAEHDIREMIARVNRAKQDVLNLLGE